MAGSPSLQSTHSCSASSWAPAWGQASSTPSSSSSTTSRPSIGLLHATSALRPLPPIRLFIWASEYSLLPSVFPTCPGMKIEEVVQSAMPPGRKHLRSLINLTAGRSSNLLREAMYAPRCRHNIMSQGAMYTEDWPASRACCLPEPRMFINNDSACEYVQMLSDLACIGHKCPSKLAGFGVATQPQLLHQLRFLSCILVGVSTHHCRWDTMLLEIAARPALQHLVQRRMNAH